MTRASPDRSGGSALRADGASVTLSDAPSPAGAHPHVCYRGAIGDSGVFSRMAAQPGRSAGPAAKAQE